MIDVISALSRAGYSLIFEPTNDNPIGPQVRLTVRGKAGVFQIEADDSDMALSKALRRVINEDQSNG